jgi:archaellum component FlaC
MTESSPDRLDRIEATLERVSQQMDNQVVLNAELRQKTAVLTDGVNVLMTSMTVLTGVTTNLTNTVAQHQEQIQALTLETRDIRSDMREIQAETRAIRSDMREMQAENRRILDIIERRLDGSN